MGTQLGRGYLPKNWNVGEVDLHTCFLLEKFLKFWNATSLMTSITLSLCSVVTPALEEGTLATLGMS